MARTIASSSHCQAETSICAFAPHTFVVAGGVLPTLEHCRICGSEIRPAQSIPRRPMSLQDFTSLFWGRLKGK